MAKKQQHPHAARRGARLGQHFLTRPEIAGWVADAAHLTHEDTVLEIGPGHGILTRELLTRAGKVIAVEKDPALVAELRMLFSDEIANGTLTLIEEDVRDFDPSTLTTPYTLAANIPYYITGRIIRQFLTARHQPTRIVLLMQKEVAERIVARDQKESLLSLSVKAYGTPELVRTVKAGAFSPPPKVDSAILAIHEIQRNLFTSSAHERLFFTTIRAAFQNKRKTIGASLKNTTVLERILAQNISPSTRPESIQHQVWINTCRP